ncbi:MAG: hypothetical protein COB16_11090 [Rhodobacteraceae bacterium]|nr:MAG: hypothetical protein COB16_11090 [Paracoccaceae bacterium]
MNFDAFKALKTTFAAAISVAALAATAPASADLMFGAHTGQLAFSLNPAMQSHHAAASGFGIGPFGPPGFNIGPYGVPGFGVQPTHGGGFGFPFNPLTPNWGMAGNGTGLGMTNLFGNPTAFNIHPIAPGLGIITIAGGIGLPGAAPTGYFPQPQATAMGLQCTFGEATVLLAQSVTDCEDAGGEIHEDLKAAQASN